MFCVGDVSSVVLVLVLCGYRFLDLRLIIGVVPVTVARVQVLMWRDHVMGVALVWYWDEAGCIDICTGLNRTDCFCTDEDIWHCMVL